MNVAAGRQVNTALKRTLVVGPRRIRWFLVVMTLAVINIFDVIVSDNARAFAQGGITSSLSGTVVDSTGSLIPGADVIVKNVGTGETFPSVTSENGTFNIPAINPGTYEVTVTGAARIQSGRLIDRGNVRLVGMTKSELGDMFKLRIDDNQRVWMLPQDVIDNTVRAFSVSATTASGYGPQGAPAGRYLAPANGPDCVEIDHDGDGLTNQATSGLNDEFGACGAGSLIVTGPMFQSVDLSVLKQVPIKGRTNLELRFEILNLLDKANFIPVGIGNLGSNANSYEVTELTGTQTSRVMQLVVRFNF